MVSLIFWRVAAVVWLLIECWLSHTPGEWSGEQSRALSTWSGVDERFLRRSAHVFLFAVLAILVLFAFPEIDVKLRIGMVAVWGFIDEATKVWIPGRHFSWIDVGLNLIGCVIGLLVWICVR